MVASHSSQAAAQSSGETAYALRVYYVSSTYCLLCFYVPLCLHKIEQASLCLLYTYSYGFCLLSDIALNKDMGDSVLRYEMGLY